MPLIAALGERDRRLRVRAASALERLGDVRAVEPLIAALGDQDHDDVQLFAASALERLGDPRALEPMRRLRVSVADPAVREAVGKLVGKLEERSWRAIRKLETVDEAVALLVELYEGHSEGLSRADHAAELVRGVGERLNAMGGFRTMREAHGLFASKRPRMARNLEVVWDGIGQWSG